MFLQSVAKGPAMVSLHWSPAIVLLFSWAMCAPSTVAGDTPSRLDHPVVSHFEFAPIALHYRQQVRRSIESSHQQNATAAVESISPKRDHDSAAFAIVLPTSLPSLRDPLSDFMSLQL
jgi:hypothetical protein